MNEIASDEEDTPGDNDGDGGRGDTSTDNHEDIRHSKNIRVWILKLSKNAENCKLFMIVSFFKKK